MKIRGYVFSLLIILACAAIPGVTSAQSRSYRQANLEVRSRSHHKQKESKKVRKAKAKAEKARKNQQKADQKATEEGIKQRFDLQTPETRKRMKQDQKRAEKNNTRYHKSLWHRIFGYQFIRKQDITMLKSRKQNSSVS